MTLLKFHQVQIVIKRNNSCLGKKALITLYATKKLISCKESTYGWICSVILSGFTVLIYNVFIKKKFTYQVIFVNIYSSYLERDI